MTDVHICYVGWSVLTWKVQTYSRLIVVMLLCSCKVHKWRKISNCIKKYLKSCISVKFWWLCLVRLFMWCQVALWWCQVCSALQVCLILIKTESATTSEPWNFAVNATSTGRIMSVGLLNQYVASQCPAWVYSSDLLPNFVKELKPRAFVMSDRVILQYSHPASPCKGERRKEKILQSDKHSYIIRTLWNTLAAHS